MLNSFRETAQHLSNLNGRLTQQIVIRIIQHPKISRHESVVLQSIRDRDRSYNCSAGFISGWLSTSLGDESGYINACPSKRIPQSE
jgi:hypothetical protein